MPPEATETSAAVTPAPAPEPKFPSGYHSNPLELIKPDLAGLKLNWGPYIVLLLLIIAAAILGVGLVIALTFAGIVVSAIAGVLVALALLILGIYAGPAFVHLKLAMARGEKMTLRQALADAPQLAWKLFFAQLLAGLAVLGGLILLVVPGLIFATWFSLVPYVVVNEGLTGTAALRRSRELVRHRFVDMVGIFALSWAANIFTIVPILGALVSIVASILLIPLVAIRYTQLHALKAAGDGADIPTSPWNWVVIALAIVAFGVSAQRDAHQVQMPQSPLEKQSQLY
jgi:hypothetical protein